MKFIRRFITLKMSFLRVDVAIIKRKLDGLESYEDKYNYAGARKKLGELKESVPTPDIRQQLSFVYKLALAYEHWDALEFPLAYENMRSLTRELERDFRLNRNFLMMDFLPTLKQQEAILKQLNELSGLLEKKQNMDILKQKD